MIEWQDFLGGAVEGNGSNNGQPIVITPAQDVATASTRLRVEWRLRRNSLSAPD